MSTRVRVHRCHCRACGRSYAVFRLAGDARGAPATDAPCAQCVGQGAEFQAAHFGYVM